MLAAGSAGKTREQLIKAIGSKQGDFANFLHLLKPAKEPPASPPFTDYDYSSEPSSRALTEKASHKPTFTRYNFVVADHRRKFEKKYINYFQYHHGPNIDVIDAVDLQNQQAVSDLTAKINNKVCRVTDGRITKCLKDQDLLSNSSGIYLANVNCFSSTWEDTYKTRVNTFYLYDGSPMYTTMFGGKIMTFFINEQGWKSAVIPYKKNYEMVVILPPEHFLPQALSPELFHKLHAGLFNPAQKKEEIILVMPEHHFHSEHNLKTLLKDESDDCLFDTEPDFTPMVHSHPARISNLNHQAIIKTDHKGSTAASITRAGITERSLSVKQLKEINCNRPFVFIIQDKDQKAIRFVGQVYRPDEATPPSWRLTHQENDSQ